MARYVTPFLAVNLGAEMVFVVAQRLEAQNIQHERSAFVLDEIINVLVSPQLITELTKPQAAYTHEALKNLIEDVTQSSAMRLDGKSMDKLWDLITMVFKWQLTLSEDLIKLTSRHLYEIESFVTLEETQLQLHKVQNLFDNYTKILSTNEQKELREHCLKWLNGFNVRVSLLLRLGLQDMEGHFIVNDLDPFAQDMLKNLGENIYSVTQNGKVMKDNKDDEPNGKSCNNGNGNELDMLAEQILGERRTSYNDNSILKLAINHKSEPNDKNQFDRIEIESNASDNKLEGLFDDLTIQDSNLHDDLIDMIENEK